LAIPILSAEKKYFQTAEKAPIEFQTNQHGISLGWSFVCWDWRSTPQKKKHGLEVQGLFSCFCRGFLPT